jgi:hypothetical protein
MHNSSIKKLASASLKKADLTYMCSYLPCEEGAKSSCHRTDLKVVDIARAILLLLREPGIIVA